MEKEPSVYPKVYDFETRSPVLQKLLKHVLPYALPMLRRIQHPLRSKNTHLLATFSPDQAERLEKLPEAFAIGLLDRNGPPGVDAWVFCSYELLDPTANERRWREAATNGHTDIVNTQNKSETHKAHVIALLSRIHQLNSPDSTSGTNPRQADTVRIGPWHAHACDMLEELGLIVYPENKPRPEAVVKYLLPMTGLPEQALSPGLPEGMKWDTVREEDFEAIMQENPYVRDKLLLRAMNGICVRLVEGGKAIAWGFIGLEGSVRTLYVDTEFRRKGLAGKLVTKLLEKTLADHRDDGWGTSHILINNKASRRLFEGMGFKEAWECRWVLVNVGEAYNRLIAVT